MRSWISQGKEEMRVSRENKKHISAVQCGPLHEYSLFRPAPHMKKGKQDTHLATFGFAGPPVSGAFFTMTFSLPHRDPIVPLDPCAATYRSPLRPRVRSCGCLAGRGRWSMCLQEQGSCGWAGGCPRWQPTSPENSRMNTWRFRN